MPGFQSRLATFDLCSGGGNFALSHRLEVMYGRESACGIPDGDTIVMTGGGNIGESRFVTRCSSVFRSAQQFFQLIVDCTFGLFSI